MSGSLSGHNSEQKMTLYILVVILVVSWNITGAQGMASDYDIIVIFAMLVLETFCLFTVSYLATIKIYVRQPNNIYFFVL